MSTKLNLLIALAFSNFMSPLVFAENWPGWRGPKGDGQSAESRLPIRWSKAENIAWKVEIPGEGHASPIVWQDHVFVVTCLPDSKDRVLMALDRATGRTLWQQTVLQSPLETKHALNSYASSTPVTDGRFIYVTFLQSSNKTVVATNVSAPRDVTLGEMLVAAYDFSGKQQWVARPGEFVSVHGYCSCPVLFENLLIVNGDHDGESYIVALDKLSGREVWRVSREHKIRSYVTPIVREFGGRVQMILSGSKTVTSYDPRTGQLIWIIDGPTEQFVASMVNNDKYVFLTAGFPDKHILAIDPTGTGNVSQSHIAWRSKQNCAYVPSPIIVGDYFLVASDDGIASCYDAATGERLWFTRLGGHFSTSPIAAGGMVYFTSDSGVTKIIRPGKKLDLVAENSLVDECFASPAASADSIFIRTRHHLVRIGNDPR